MVRALPPSTVEPLALTEQAGSLQITWESSDGVSSQLLAEDRVERRRTQPTDHERQRTPSPSGATNRPMACLPLWWMSGSMAGALGIAARFGCCRSWHAFDRHVPAQKNRLIIRSQEVHMLAIVSPAKKLDMNSLERSLSLSQALMATPSSWSRPATSAGRLDRFTASRNRSQP